MKFLFKNKYTLSFIFIYYFIIRAPSSSVPAVKIIKKNKIITIITIERLFQLVIVSLAIR